MLVVEENLYLWCLAFDGPFKKCCLVTNDGLILA